MRVAYFADVVELGGAELSLLDYFRTLPALPFEALLITPREGPLTEAARAIGADCRIVPMPELVAYERNPNVFKATPGAQARAAYFASASRSLWRLAAALRRWEIDILHTNGLRSHLYGAAATTLVGCHTVWHVRDIIVKPWQLRLFRGAGRWVDRIICVSEPARRSLVGDRDRLARKSITIHNAIDLDQYHPDPWAVEHVCDELGLAGSFPVVSLVGQVTPNKGQSDLLAAAPAVLARLPHARFLIVGQPLMGEDHYEQQLYKQAALLGIADRVIFTGFRSDVAAILGASDVAVAPSWQEPYPRTAMEAFAAGVPVVATRVGGIPELIREGETGLLVEPHRPDQLADAIVHAIDPATHDQLTRAAGRFAVERCGVGTEMARIAAIYEAVLRMPSGSLGGVPTDKIRAA
jgi:glycosyltransferase involved in cell wall biosynthesis